MKEPLISICCIAYNQEPFIRQCLDGFLMQQGVDYEILIHDDCSTDGTTEIIRDYAAKYPDKIFPMYEEVNQYQNGKNGEIDQFNYRRARGKYIAYCEGDDYWSDPLKLKKQVDFMEAHPDYSICFHDFDIYYCDTNQLHVVEPKEVPMDADNGAEFLLKDYIWGRITGQPLTMMFRRDMYNLNWYKQYKNYRDTHEIYHLLKVGKGRYMNFKGAIYHRHSDSETTNRSWYDFTKVARDIMTQIYSRNGNDRDLRDLVLDMQLWTYRWARMEHREKEFWTYWRESFTQMPELNINSLVTIIKRNIRHTWL